MNDGTVLRSVAYSGLWDLPRVTADGRFWLVGEDSRYYGLAPLTPAEILDRAVQLRGGLVVP